jgi:hypothetical protein
MPKVTVRYSETTPQERKKLIREAVRNVDVNESLDELIAIMTACEERFGMSTVEFYARFVAGKMGDSAEVMQWAMAYDAYNHLIREHFQRKAVG